MDVALCLHALTVSQRTIVETLRRSGPLSVAPIASSVGVTASAVRQNLKGLVAAGLVTSSTASSGLRGRPAFVYALTLEGRGLFPRPQPERLMPNTMAILNEIRRREPRLVAEVVRDLGHANSQRRRASLRSRSWPAAGAS